MALPRSTNEVMPVPGAGAPDRVSPEVAAVSVIRPDAPSVVTPEMAPAVDTFRPEEAMARLAPLRPSVIAVALVVPIPKVVVVVPVSKLVL